MQVGCEPRGRRWRLTPATRPEWGLPPPAAASPGGRRAEGAERRRGRRGGARGRPSRSFARAGRGRMWDAGSTSDRGRALRACRPALICGLLVGCERERATSRCRPMGARRHDGTGPMLALGALRHEGDWEGLGTNMGGVRISRRSRRREELGLMYDRRRTLADWYYWRVTAGGAAKLGTEERLNDVPKQCCHRLGANGVSCILG